MPLNLQIMFRGMDPSESAEAQVRRRAEELDEFSDRINSCRVTLEAAHRHHRQGKLYQVHIDVLGARQASAGEPQPPRQSRA